MLISSDDPGALSSQCEEDTRILVHNYAHVPIFDPSSVQEAYAMTKAAFEIIGKNRNAFYPAAGHGGSIMPAEWLIAAN